MGSSPKTKADYKKQIAEKNERLAYCKNQALIAQTKAGKDAWKREANDVKAQIANLKLKMADAPSK